MPSERSNLVLGIGDDAAIFRPRANEDLVFTTDMLIEDVHFTRAKFTAAEAGHKALARSLSDLAAMGAEPRFALLSVALPAVVTAKWRDGFFHGFLDLAKRTRTVLAGGDLSRGPVVIADVMCCGGVPRGKALRRVGARAGDVLYVSGPLGLGWQRNRKPEPRIAYGKLLRGRATACMDLSDGLAMDLRRLCAASGVGARIDAIPVARGATRDSAMNAGEDYELLFSLPAKKRPPVWAHRVGEVTGGREILVFGEPLVTGGWDHFR
jgi:thiamine-monophosphate kinase